MGEIFVLDEALINKIAAGEVIERPASIVKELVENSIDAKARRIFIEVKDGGKSYIKVADDGSGMSRADSELSWFRHATSKIRTAGDLFNVHTLGFRGEALASIASVSEMIILTRRDEDLAGTRVRVRGGKKVLSEVAGCPKGTGIEVLNLFFNTPVRLKYLKSPDIELRHIIDIVMRYSIIHPEVHFKLLHDNKEILNSPGTRDMLANISFIYGKDFAKQLLEVDFDNRNIQVKGFVSRPIFSRPTKNEQSFYVNKRYIKKNSVISDALNNAFHTFMMVNRYPAAILDIVVPPLRLDVNVHPQKSEIRIEDEKALYSAVYDSVKAALEGNDIVPEVLEKESEKKISDFPDMLSNLCYESKYPAQNLKQTMLVKDTVFASTEKLPDIRIIGTVNKTYFLAEVPGNLILIDQHAAAERILYEKFSEQLRHRNVKVQELLTPEIVELSPHYFNVAEMNRDFLRELGYNIESFGHNTVLVRTIPVVLGKQFDWHIFLDFLSELGSKERPESLEKFFHDKIARMSCRSAIKAGDEVTFPQIKEYLQEILKESFPATCPHGRPILIKWSIYELEKMFKRVV